MKNVMNLGKSLVIGGLIFFASVQASYAGEKEAKELDSLVSTTIDELLEEIQIETSNPIEIEFFAFVEMEEGEIVKSTMIAANEMVGTLNAGLINEDNFLFSTGTTKYYLKSK